MPEEHIAQIVEGIFFLLVFIKFKCYDFIDSIYINYLVRFIGFQPL